MEQTYHITSNGFELDPVPKGGDKVTEIGIKFDMEKMRWDLQSLEAIAEVVKRTTHGAIKYGPNNWQNVPDAKERYYAALMRHLEAYRRGERMDPEAPGLTHIGAVGWNALTLIWFDLQEQK